MQVEPTGLPIPPRWNAAARQTADHALDAARFGKQAVGEADKAKRFDLAYRAYNSFDNAIEASQRLPLGRFDGIRAAYDGYETARNALGAIVATGAIKGMNLRVGRQEMLAGREEFHRGIDAVKAASPTDIDRYRALDWFDASTRDAATGAVMLRTSPKTALPLVVAIRGARQLVISGKQIPADLVDKVDKLYRDSIGTFDQLLAGATATDAAS